MSSPISDVGFFSSSCWDHPITGSKACPPKKVGFKSVESKLETKTRTWRAFHKYTNTQQTPRIHPSKNVFKIVVLTANKNQSANSFWKPVQMDWESYVFFGQNHIYLKKREYTGENMRKLWDRYIYIYI